MSDHTPSNLVNSSLDEVSHFLMSSKAISVCHSIDELTHQLDTCLKKLGLFCSYQLNIGEHSHIKHFEEGQLKDHKDVAMPSGCQLGKSKLIALESSSIFKLHFIQLHIEHRQKGSNLTEQIQNLLMMWLQQIETWCFMWQKQR